MAEPIPESAANAADFNYAVINREWAGLLVGLLDPLRDPDYWDGDESEQSAAINQVELLQLLLMNETLMPNVAFQAQKASDQAFTSGTPALCAFATVQNNQGGYYATANSRFTPLVAGRYAVYCNLGFTGTGSREVYLRKNGSVIAQAFAAYPGSNERSALSLYHEVDLDGIDDYLDIFCARSGANITAASGAHSWWGARLVVEA